MPTTSSSSRKRYPYPKMHVEQRWTRRGGMAWCIIQDEKVFPVGFGGGPFQCDRAMHSYKKTGVADHLMPSTRYSRKAPPGEVTQKWLRQNDTRHPKYSGA